MELQSEPHDRIVQATARGDRAVGARHTSRSAFLADAARRALRALADAWAGAYPAGQGQHSTRRSS